MKLLDDEKTLKDEPTVAVVTWGGGFSLVNQTSRGIVVMRVRPLLA